jgi:hypothetical protein
MPLEHTHVDENMQTLYNCGKRKEKKRNPIPNNPPIKLHANDKIP